MSPTLLHVEPVRRYLERRVLCSVPARGKLIALTFDDGPSPRNTPPLLDLLKHKQIPATFFVLGKRLKYWDELTLRAHDEGHEIESHGHWHLPLPMLPTGMLRREVRDMSDTIETLTGRRPRFLRPPMGWFSRRCLRVLREEGVEPVIGNIHPEDSRQLHPDRMLRRIRRHLGPGSILILHDGGWRATVDRSRTLEVVDQLTDELGGQGYRFVRLDELAGPGISEPDPAASP